MAICPILRTYEKTTLEILGPLLKTVLGRSDRIAITCKCKHTWVAVLP